MALVASEQIIIELCHETGEPGLINNQRIWGVFLDGVRDMAIFNMPTWEIINGLTLNSYNAIDWPCECVKPLITFLERNGRALALSVDNSIISAADTRIKTLSDASQEVEDFFRIDGFAGYPDYFRTYNFGLGEVYGYGSGYNHVGMVIPDKERRQSFIKGCRVLSTDTFGMFCKTDGLSGEKPIYVPAECKEPIENFALYKYYRVRNPNLAATFFEKYTQFCYRLTKFNNDSDEQDWNIAVNGNTMSAPKGL